MSVTQRESRTDYARAELQGILDPSPHRRVPPCALSGICGGCDWLYMDYEAQLEEKKAIAHETLRRVGGMELPEIDIEPGAPLGYRARLQVHRDPQGALGFMGVRSHTIVPVRTCPVATPEANSVFTAPAPDLERFTVFGHGGAFACEGVPEKDELSVTVNGIPIFFSVRCFFQSNVPMLEKLAAFVTEALRAAEAGQGGRAADLYCGVGVFGAHLSTRFTGITSVESDRLSVLYAKRNVPRGRNKFFATTMERWAGSPESRGPFDAIVVDPPRTGLTPAVRKYLAGIKPRRLVYVSCNIVTLSRDLASLVSGGFSLRSLRLFHFYPQTSHVEAAAVLYLQ